MQKGMTEHMHKDILKDADRQTKARFTRMNPDLAEFMDAIEKWLLSETRQAQTNGKPQAPNGTIGKGGRGF